MRLWTDPYRRRWLVFGVFAAVYAAMSIYRLSTAVLAEQLLAAFAVSATGLGTLHASFFYIYAAMQLPAGVLADRIGARWTIVGGTVAMSMGGLWFGLAQGFPGAFAGRALIGLGGGVLFVAILRFCANWFRRDEFARMSGLTIAVAGFGGILATTPLALVVAAAGWRETMVGLGLVGFGLAGVVAIVASDSPDRAGLPPIEGVPVPGSPGLRQVGRNALAVLRERESWLIGLALFFGTGVNITVFGLWGVPYVVQTYGLSVPAASVYTLLGSAGLLVGPPGLGWLSDRLGRRTPVMIAGQVVFVGAFGTLALTGDPPLVIVGVVFFLAGTLAGTFALGYAVVTDRHGSEAGGVATGTVNTMAFIGAAVFPTAMGVILDAYSIGEVNGTTAYSVLGYRYAFALATAAAVLALGSTVWLHLRLHGPTARGSPVTSTE